MEVFSRRSDELVKRVRDLETQTVEDHFKPGRTNGLALVVEVLGKKRDVYFFRGSRIDGLIKRSHLVRLAFYLPLNVAPSLIFSHTHKTNAVSLQNHGVVLGDTIKAALPVTLSCRPTV